MSLSTGTRLGPYEILTPLGAGGMGEVYKARDTRLDRTVAIKVLPEHLSQKPQLRERFEREARAVSSLNHSNICTLHDVGQQDDVDYLVMEYLEGDTLAQRLKNGPLPLDQVLRHAIEIASALDHAHRHGVVHRDLKPGNIMLTKAGAKVLDFGLAKVLASSGTSDVTRPTNTLTQEGAILGTLQYMAPEQLEGKEADTRSDIFAFGSVVYEMATGKKAFEGKSRASVIAAIMQNEPALVAQLQPTSPTGLDHVIRRCMAKEPDQRWQAASDVKLELEWIAQEKAKAPVPMPLRGGRRLGLEVLAAVLAVGLASVAFLHFRERPPAPAAPVRFQIPAPENAELLLNLSPDGRNLAFIAGDRLWVHSLESGESRSIADSGGTPFWSPDSRFIGYPSRGKLKKIEATGGPAQTVTDIRSLWGGGAWNQDDVIVFGVRQVGLFRVPASGGVPVQITALDPARQENSQFSPSFLPDGRHFVYVGASTDEAKCAIYLGSVDAKPEQQSSKPLVASKSQPAFAPSADPSTGYLLFVREGTLMAQPFDNRRLELKGQAAPVAEQVSPNFAGAIYVAFSASANDVLAFQRTAALQLTWFDRAGKVVGTAGDPGDYYGDLALSPDGTRLAVTKAKRADTGYIWLLDLSRGGASERFTFGSASEGDAIWSPDGSRIIFSSNREGAYNLYQKPSNGVKDEVVLLKSSENKTPTSWSRDGGLVLYEVDHAKTKSDIWVLPMDSDNKPLPFLITDFSERQARFSPDGHWVAYTSNESGQDEVYVRSFSMNSARTTVEAGGKVLVSNGGGMDPRWRNDGRELYYRSRGRRLMAVEIVINPVFRPGNPQPLGVSTSESWDSAADGKRFLAQATKSGPQPYTVVLNWQSGLKK